MTDTEVSDTELETDLLVIGAGIAGMSAAATAARGGARVVVVEKAAELGGSAVLSGGGLWTTTSLAAYRELDPRGDDTLVALLVSRFADAAAFVSAIGAEIADPAPVDRIQGYPSEVRVFDNYGYIQRCHAVVTAAGGWVVTSADTKRLILEDGRVVGAVIVDRDGEVSVRAPHTVLATGGFQGSPDLCRSLIGEHAAGLPLRANPNSDGAGLRLATAAGAAVVAETDYFYGHLVVSPLPEPFRPGDFLRLAQIYSAMTILLDRDGKRFCDESRSYYRNAYEVSRLPGRRALLVADETVREADRNLYGRSTETVDRPLEAQAVGARSVIVDTLDELDAAVAEWGFTGVAEAVREYNKSIENDPDSLEPPRAGRRAAYSQPPYFAMEVQPAITFSFGGVRADDHARVLDGDGRPIPGLLAAGVDIGVYYSLYAGGLAFGLVTGIVAAETALAAAPGAPAGQSV